MAARLVYAQCTRDARTNEKKEEETKATKSIRKPKRDEEYACKHKRTIFR